MGYRETYNTDPVALSDPLFLANIVNGELADATYSIFAYKTPDAPSGVAVCLWSRVLNTGDPCDITWRVFRFDGDSGDAMTTLPSGDAFGANLHLNIMRDQRDGNVYVFSNLTATIYRWDIFVTQKIGAAVTPTLPLSKFGDGPEGGTQQSAYDPVRDLIVQQMIFEGGQQGRIATYNNTDPYAIISDAHTAGLVHNLFLLEHPYAVSVSRTGVASTFNYETGQIIHVTKHRPQLAGSTDTSRLYGFDRYNHRLLICDLQAQVGGDEVTFIRGFSPVPIIHHLQQPVAVREPRVNAVTRIFTRAIGSSGEGVAGVAVTFSDEGVGDVAPVTIITDEHGWAEANYDGLATGGAETITVSAVVPDDLFAPAGGQGAGFGPPVWTPDIDLDFNGFGLPQQPVDVIIAEQTDWQQGTTSPRGCRSILTVKKIGKTSSAEINIASGTTGTPDNPTDGTFGGNIIPTTTNQVAFDGQVWFGAWVQFPAGFDFTTTSDGLLLFRLGNDQTANYVEIRLKHGGGTTHTGYELMWPDETVTDARHDFTAHSSGLISDDTWHFFQFYSNNKDVGADAAQRLWIDGILLWELVDDQARHLETAGAGALVDFTANEAIPTATNTNNKFDEIRIFNNWEGGAPGDEVLYCQTVVWTQDALGLLGVDSEGNTYIDTTQQENL